MYIFVTCTRISYMCMYVCIYIYICMYAKEDGHGTSFWLPRLIKSASPLKYGSTVVHFFLQYRRSIGKQQSSLFLGSQVSWCGNLSWWAPQRDTYALGRSPLHSQLPQRTSRYSKAPLTHWGTVRARATDPTHCGCVSHLGVSKIEAPPVGLRQLLLRVP